ncbi:MAG: PQQ-like beta-propeller repeat protein [Holosporales bacterium]|nr:PQQ-like beta-propeller repeat protein [Holosporales bacterium]
MVRNKVLFTWCCVAAVLMTACDKKEKLPGKREPISGIPSMVDTRSGIDPDLMGQVVQLPPASREHWFVDVMGNKQHTAINHELSHKPKLLWETSIGRGPICSDIIAYSNLLYAIDAIGELNCVEQRSGKIVWKRMVAKQPDESSFSGGLTADNGVVYVSTNIGHVLAIDAKTGKELWNVNLKFPMKGPPLYVPGNIIVTAINNQTFALDPRNGNTLWGKTMNQEQTIMREASVPAVTGNSLICTYSSGDILAIDMQDGAELWTDTLFSGSMADSGSMISHIAASPVVIDGFALVLTSESRAAMIDVTTGIRVWEQSFGTTLTPAVIRDWAFILSNDNTLSCISLKTGRVKWTTDVKDFCDNKRSKKNRVKWIGPVLINGSVVVFSDGGDMVYFDASTGNLKKKDVFAKLPFARAPIIVDKLMFAVSEMGKLYAIG